MGLEFRLLDEDGAELVVLPSVESFSLSPVICDLGAIEFSYPRDGINWSSIKGKDEFRLAIYVDGERQPTLDGWVKDVSGDDVSDQPWKFTGHFNNGRLAEAIVYPKNWPTVDPTNTKQLFSTATAGTIIKTLMQQAQARGTLTEVTTASFTSTHDSNGVPWDKILTVEYAPQLDYLKILRNLYEQQVAEFEMVGNDLRLYVIDSMSVDRTLQDPPLVFRKGRDLSDSPRKLSTRDLGTVVLASGEDGLFVERVDAAGVASRRRIEKEANQGQIKDAGTLTAYADATLDQVKQAKMEKTHGLSFGEENTPRPLRNFDVGDWAFSDMGNGLERLRIKQWVLSLSASGELSGSVTMNDFFAEQNEVLARRVEGIVGGSTITGGSQAVEVVPGDLVDGLAPATPTPPVLASLAYMDDQGHTYAQVSASWLQVTTNSDGTAIEDLEGYRLRWREVGSSAWEIRDVGNATITSWSPVSPGINIEVQLQAYDRAGNSSPWSGLSIILTGFDATPPEAPSTPIVDNYLGLLRIQWDGGTASGAVLAPDFKYVEVHVSDTNNFTPDNTTRTDTLSAAGSSFYEVAPNLTRYVKLIAVDHSKNKSAPSAQGSGASWWVVDTDIFIGAVGTAKLADLAVTTAKINLLAVNSAQVGSLDVGKLTAGILNAQVTITGRLATALTGARREMNGIGFQAWDDANNLIINLDGVNNLLTGQFKTGLSGTRRIEMGVAGFTGAVNFIAPDGEFTRIDSLQDTSGAEGMRVGFPNPAGTWHAWGSMHFSAPFGLFSTLAYTEFVVGGNGSETAKEFRVSYASNRGTTTTFPTKVGRIWINSAITQFAAPDGPTGTRYDLNNGKHALRIPTGEFMQVQTNGNPQQGSALIQGFTGTATNGGIYGGSWRFSMGQPGVSVGWDSRYFDDNGYIPVRASSFDVSSSITEKENVVDFAGSALEVLGRMKVKKYRRKPPKIPALRPVEKGPGDSGPSVELEPATDLPVPEQREQIGLIAEEAPAEVVTPLGYDEIGIDLYAMISLTAAAVNELRDRLDGMEGGPKK